MSDTTERDAVCQEFGAWYRGAIPEEVHWGSAEAMADEIVRLRDENVALTAAVERVRALHQEGFTRGCCRTCKGRDDIHVALPCPTLRALEVGRE